jgi:hypothetical protein
MSQNRLRQDGQWKLFSIAAFLGLILSVAAIASAQDQVSQHSAGWSKWSGPRLILDPNAPLIGPEQGGLEQPDSPARLEGTWELNESFSPGGSDPALYTFSAGPDPDHGTVVMSDTYIFTGNPSCIPAQGAWQRIANRSFVGKHKCFAYDDNNGFAPAGWVIWRYAVTLSQDGSSLFGRTVLDFYDANGNYLFSSPAALQGSRMVPQAPPR